MTTNVAIHNMPRSHAFFETIDHDLKPPTTPAAIDFYSKYWQWLKQATLETKGPFFSIPNLQSHLHLMSQMLPALVQLDHDAIGGFQSSAKGAKRWFKFHENASDLERACLLRTEECYGISFQALEVQHLEKLEALDKDLKKMVEINGDVNDLLLVGKILEHVKKPLKGAVKGVLVCAGGKEFLIGG